MASVEIDGQMCEDIRIGIHARQAFRSANGVALMFRKKGSGMPWMSFSSTVLDVAGGFLRFLAEWECCEERYDGQEWNQLARPLVAP